MCVTVATRVVPTHNTSPIGWYGSNKICFRRCLQYELWVVVSIFFCFHPYLGKIPILTNIFQMGWNHQLGTGVNKMSINSNKNPMLSNMRLSCVALFGQDEQQRCPLIYLDLFQDQAILFFFLGGSFNVFVVFSSLGKSSNVTVADFSMKSFNHQVVEYNYDYNPKIPPVQVCCTLQCCSWPTLMVSWNHQLLGCPRKLVNG